MPMQRALDYKADLDLERDIHRASASTPLSFPETQSRHDFIEHNLTRARVSFLIALALVSWVSVIGLLGGLETGNILITSVRLGVIFPALCVALAGCYLPGLRPYYTALVGFGITVAGLGVIFAGVWTTAHGVSFVKVTTILIMVHATLVLGLRTRATIVVATIFLAGYLLFATLYRLPGDEIVFMASVLIATAAIAVQSTHDLEQSLQRNFREKRILAEQAQRDGLTGLYNRRMFDDYTPRLWDQAKRDNATLQLILFDVDYFKIYNDIYGHQAGDNCLKRIAAICADHAKRPLDFCARYGGEEFALLRYHPREVDPLVLPRQIHESVLNEAILHEGSRISQIITVSVGSATARPRLGNSLEGLIQKADEALYRAKQTGRNRFLHKDPGDDDSATGDFKV